jgi:hypothetical protein
MASTSTSAARSPNSAGCSAAGSNRKDGAQAESENPGTEHPDPLAGGAPGLYMRPTENVRTGCTRAIEAPPPRFANRGRRTLRDWRKLECGQTTQHENRCCHCGCQDCFAVTLRTARVVGGVVPRAAAQHARLIPGHPTGRASPATVADSDSRARDKNFRDRRCAAVISRQRIRQWGQTTRRENRCRHSALDRIVPAYAANRALCQRSCTKSRRGPRASGHSCRPRSAPDGRIC